MTLLIIGCWAKEIVDHPGSQLEREGGSAQVAMPAWFEELDVCPKGFGKSSEDGFGTLEYDYKDGQFHIKLYDFKKRVVLMTQKRSILDIQIAAEEKEFKRILLFIHSQQRSTLSTLFDACKNTLGYQGCTCDSVNLGKTSVQ